MIFRAIAVFQCVCLLTFSLSAGKIEKGFQALSKKNYFDADYYFRKSLKKHRALAAYGLSELFLKSDYRNLDSAHKYILMSESNFGVISPKKKQKIQQKLKIDSLAIDKQKHLISNEIFDFYKQQAKEALFIDFLAKNTWSDKIPSAIIWRDSLAFQTAEKENTSAAFQLFLQKYPESNWKTRATTKFLDLQYDEFARKQTLFAFEEFLATFPNNPHVADAENEIYRLAVPHKIIVQYHAFVKSYPTNRNVKDAWRAIYKLFVTEYSYQRIQEFLTEYPEYPFRKELEEDLSIFNSVYFPFMRNGLYGYMDSEGRTLIQPQYETAYNFQDGIAVVAKNGKWGLINKKNQALIDFSFDEISEFVDNRAVVTLNNKQGLIDRSGRLVVPPDQEDILSLGSDLIAIRLKDDVLYGLYNLNFEIVNTNRFFEVNAFQKGISIVKMENGYGLLSSNGNLVQSGFYESLRAFNDSIYEYVVAGKKGLMLTNGQKLTEAIYDEFSRFDASGRQLLARQGTQLIYLNERGQRYFPYPAEYFSGALETAQFYNGIAIYRKKGKFGLFDLNNKEVLKPTYDRLGRVGPAVPAQKEAKWGIIDYKGRTIIPFEFDQIETLPNYGYLMEKAGKLGFYDINFRLVLGTEYDIIKVFESDFLLVSQNEKYGLYTIKGEQLLPFEYNAIQVFEKDCLILTKDTETAYYYLRSNLYLKHER